MLHVTTMPMPGALAAPSPPPPDRGGRLVQPDLRPGEGGGGGGAGGAAVPRRARAGDGRSRRGVARLARQRGPADRRGRDGWSDAPPETAGWWNPGSVYRIDDTLHARIDEAREDAALEIVSFVFKQSFGNNRVKLHLSWGGAFPGTGSARADRRRVLPPGRAARPGDLLRADARRERGDAAPGRLPRRLLVPGAPALRQLPGSPGGLLLRPRPWGALGRRAGRAPPGALPGGPIDGALHARPGPPSRSVGVGASRPGSAIWTRPCLDGVARPGRSRDLRNDLLAVCDEMADDLAAQRLPTDYKPLTRIVDRLMRSEPLDQAYGERGNSAGMAG